MEPNLNEANGSIDQPIKLHYTPVINFALQQNYVPAIRSITISNTSAVDLHRVAITINCEPDFANSWQHTIDRLKAGESLTLDRITLSASSKFLADLTEKMSANYTVTVSADGVTPLTEIFPVELLAYDQWNGIGLLPEMLAAFVTPNHPEISNIIRAASVILQRWTGNPSFDEYQSRNPDRVRKQMAAIYEAIAELQFVYCTVPASFEESGQRVRLADAIFSNRLANCLDLSLLYAACLEAVGIHPLLMVVKGHAFAGGWLIDESFADAVNDDGSLITKRIADGINEIAIVEATCMNAGSHTPFDEAARSAEQKMRPEDFILFIDVKRARFSSIRPLPLRIPTATGWEVIADTRPERANISPDEIYVGQKIINVPKINVSKQRLWERKLLDLTLRNSLLNIRITKSVIQFLTIDTGKLEDALANGDEFQILSKPTDWDNPVRDTGLYSALHSSDPIAELVKHELSHKRIRTYLSDVELNNGLTNLFRTSRLSIEENGANTLYIGLGLLRWYETDASERPRYAPILLLPVDIIRKSAQRGYVIRGREEETMMNITLLEMLRQDFGLGIGGLETLPKDDSGVDVRAIFNVIRQAIMSRARWDIEDQAVLGTFSFSKFILWNDIHNNADKLCRNKVVSSLVSGKLEWQAEENAPVGAITDELLHPSQLALPISTDSSQLQAILSSGQGKSFVLHGPPGTGKSQTITNIIANALYAGKRVLFVAAKKAALDVVESRLESVGLGPFCLELHSNKAKKSGVIEQLKAAAEVAHLHAPESFSAEAERLFVLRNELNLYVTALHKKHPFGHSLFDIFTAYSSLPKGSTTVHFAPSVFDELTNTQVTNWQDIAEEMQTVGIVIGKVNRHPLQALRPANYSPRLKQDAHLLIEQLLQSLKQFKTVTDITTDLLKMTGMVTGLAHEEALELIVKALIDLGDVPASMLQTDATEQTLAQVIGIAGHGQLRDQYRAELLNSFQKTILDFPAAQTLTDWNLADGKWFLPKWMGQRKVTKQISSLSTIGSIDKNNIPQLLQQIIAYQQEQELIDKAGYLPALIGFLWRNGEVDWVQLKAKAEAVIQLNRSAAVIAGSMRLKDWRAQLAAEFTEGSLDYVNEHRQVLDGYAVLANNVRSLQSELVHSLNVDLIKLTSTGTNWKDTIINAAAGWLQHINELANWFNWLQVKNKAERAGLGPLVIAFETGAVNSNEVVLHFQKGFYRSAADHILVQNPQMATFNSTLFEDKIRKFREVSEQFEALTKQELYARLAAKIPSFTQEASQSSEIGILQRNIRNNGRAMSIRKIFDAIPNLLPRLTPCMLMSPISVAQYFDADSVKFDLVIFDEASQMPTCEAVGAIARATNVIVVGDPKQMPPTSFFATNNVDEDNIDKEDLESILDDCLALSMPSQHLLWHYRSKHESLIAFSNAKYYDNKLLTFPSIDDITSKVTFVPVDGYYDKGKSRQNSFEAKAIVAEVAQRLSDPISSQRSIGIVTFSSVQQLLIDDMLTDLFRLRPDLEKIANEGKEPMFIKNLENVQGDERDVILFSVGYGPDQQGRVSINFGPINRDGGWRRLNVAVSRARYEMKVFSTLRADQIDLNRTASEGVAGLKAFLAYAEKGKSTLPLRNAVKNNSEASFEVLLADEIRALGYAVHTQIGSSEYKIDLGIVDKENPAKYILGVLTDGKNYHNAKTSRDREIVQMDVLRALGWNIHKIWSTEWWEKPEKVISNLMAAIKRSEETYIADQPLVSTPPVFDKPTSQTLAGISAPGAIRPVPKSVAIPYEICEIDRQEIMTTDDILLRQNWGKLKAQVFNVLQTESPISKNLLTKRVSLAWGVNRLGSRLFAHFDTLYQQMNIRQVAYSHNVYFWKGDQSPDHYTQFRVASNDNAKRDADDLPPEEVANAVKEILRNQVSLSKPDLVRETAKVFGFARAGANVENAMLLGIQKSIEQGEASEENGKVITTG